MPKCPFLFLTSFFDFRLRLSSSTPPDYALSIGTDFPLIFGDGIGGVSIGVDYG